MKHSTTIEFNNISFDLDISKPVFYELEGLLKYNIVQTVQKDNSALQYKVWFEGDILCCDYPIDQGFLQQLSKIIKD